MSGDDGAGDGVREILMVLAVAFAGLFLAALAAFTPWYAAVSGPAGASVVEMRGPAGAVAPGVEP
jgi:hypothetical protein